MKVYLASPYSHENLAVRQWRFEATAEKVGSMIKTGYLVFSPIVHCHPIATSVSLPTDFIFWQTYAEAFLDWADEMWIYALPGWDKSFGIKKEIEICERLNKPFNIEF